MSTVSTEQPDTVSVLYALPDEQLIVPVPFRAGMTAHDAFVASGLGERYPAIGREPLVLGVWGVEVDSGLELKSGDRVEISRPLVADPREMRREFLSDGKVMGGAEAPAPGVRKKARE